MFDYIKRYDSVPYPSIPHHLTHPDHLETTGRLLNLQVANSESARILEIGSGCGGNIIPLAEQLPGSEFVAIDLSAVQVAAGQQTIAQLGLRNLDMRHANLMTLDESYGKFDYIICHGIFSWVPEAVRHRLLQVCQERLAPCGIAYISYNTYPGWHMREMLRRILQYQVSSITDPLESVQEARRFLNYLVETLPDKKSFYGRFLSAHNDQFSRWEDSYLLHDYLEETNQPFYFHEFIALAQQYGLSYLANSERLPTGLSSHPPAIHNASSNHLPTFEEREQINDFIHNRSFRQSLLCHAATTIDHTIYASKLRNMFVSCALQPSPVEVSASPSSKPSRLNFVDFTGTVRLTTHEPLVIATLERLSTVYPDYLPFKSLVQAALASAHANPASYDSFRKLESQLANCVTQLYAQGLIELSAHPPRFTLQVSDKPRVSPLTSLQAAKGELNLTNRRHRLVCCESLTRQLVQLTDGSRNHEQLTYALTERANVEGLPEMPKAKTPQSQISPKSAEPVSPITLQSIKHNLRNLARNCLLID